MTTCNHILGVRYDDHEMLLVYGPGPWWPENADEELRFKFCPKCGAEIPVGPNQDGVAK